MYINAAFNNGWSLGYEDATFRPDIAITRAEAIAMINRVLNRVPTPASIHAALDGNVLFHDLSQNHWAFYYIMEASIEHDFIFNEQGMEQWTWFELPRR